MACEACGLPVASRIDDCSLWQAVRLAPNSVRRIAFEVADSAVLAGPGHPTPGPDADMVLVPTHPQTGQTWTPPGPPTTAYPVPLPFGVWLWLAFPKPHLPVPASGGMPDGVLRDDPPAPRPLYLFRADPGAFQHTLVRLPAVRSPWLREISASLPQHMRAGLF